MTNRPASIDRPVSRRSILAGGVSASVLAALGPAGLARAQSQVLQMGSASLGATGYVIIETLSAIVNKYSDPKLRTSSMSTGGGAENMALLGEGLLDFGQTTSADWHPAMNGLAPYTKPIEVEQMFSYMVWSPTLLVRADSDIQSIDDLAGKRVSTGPAGGSATRVYKSLFKAAGMTDSVELHHASWRGCYDAFKQGAVASVSGIFTVGKPSPILQELESTVEVRPLEMPSDVVAKASEDNPGVLTFELTPDKWSTIEEPVVSPAFAGILAAHPRVGADVGYNVTKAVYEHAEEVRKINNLMSNINADFATKYLMKGIPVNAGAARYFQEIGAWRDELTIAET